MNKNSIGIFYVGSEHFNSQNFEYKVVEFNNDEDITIEFLGTKSRLNSTAKKLQNGGVIDRFLEVGEKLESVNGSVFKVLYSLPQGEMYVQFVDDSSFGYGTQREIRSGVIKKCLCQSKINFIESSVKPYLKRIEALNHE